MESLKSQILHNSLSFSMLYIYDQLEHLLLEERLTYSLDSAVPGTVQRKHLVGAQ